MLIVSQALTACWVLYKQLCTYYIINHHTKCIIGIINSNFQGRKLRLRLNNLSKAL